MFLPGFVCEFVRLFVNRITQKLMDGFCRNFQDMSEKVKEEMIQFCDLLDPEM